jgi:hypothetical protein
MMTIYRQVALFIDDQYFCGGSLISNEWVLTAARKSCDFTSFNIRNLIQINCEIQCQKQKICFVFLIRLRRCRRLFRHLLGIPQCSFDRCRGTYSR